MCNNCNKYCVTPTVNNQRAIGEKGKFWKTGDTINIFFLEGTEAQKKVVERFANYWLNYANLKFNWNSNQQDSDVRISFIQGWGSWSYVGTDCLFINKDNPTMNFGWVTGNLLDQLEDKAVILHEFGHMLGLGHEHQSPFEAIKWDVEKVYADLMGYPNYWDKETIDYNVIIPYTTSQVIGTTLDPNSIMMYPIPNSWTLNDFETGFNYEISPLDISFVQSLYPVITSNPVEPKPYDNTLDTLKFVFRSKKELNKLNEINIVRIGMLLELNVDIKNSKRQNCNIVADYLKLK